MLRVARVGGRVRLGLGRRVVGAGPVAAEVAGGIRVAGEIRVSGQGEVVAPAGVPVTAAASASATVAVASDALLRNCCIETPKNVG